MKILIWWLIGTIIPVVAFFLAVVTAGESKDETSDSYIMAFVKWTFPEKFGGEPRFKNAPWYLILIRIAFGPFYLPYKYMRAMVEFHMDTREIEAEQSKAEES